jgi:DNA-binding NarL/FixJ family response regulator
MTSARLIRTFLVEDHPVVREEIGLLLHSYPNIDFIGKAVDGEEAVLEVAKLQPSVVIMDINLPKMDGIAATRMIKMKFPHIVVIGVTSTPRDYLVYAMLKAGAFEVLAKEQAANDLYSTIQRAVAAANPILILETGDLGPEDTRPAEEAKISITSDQLPATEPNAKISPEDES